MQMTAGTSAEAAPAPRLSLPSHSLGGDSAVLQGLPLVAARSHSSSLCPSHCAMGTDTTAQGGCGGAGPACVPARHRAGCLQDSHQVPCGTWGHQDQADPAGGGRSALGLSTPPAQEEAGRGRCFLLLLEKNGRDSHPVTSRGRCSHHRALRGLGDPSHAGHRGAPLHTDPLAPRKRNATVGPGDSRASLFPFLDRDLGSSSRSKVQGPEKTPCSRGAVASASWGRLPQCLEPRDGPGLCSASPPAPGPEAHPGPGLPASSSARQRRALVAPSHLRQSAIGIPNTRRQHGPPPPCTPTQPPSRGQRWRWQAAV